MRMKETDIGERKENGSGSWRKESYLKTNKRLTSRFPRSLIIAFVTFITTITANIIILTTPITITIPITIIIVVVIIINSFPKHLSITVRPKTL